MLRSIELVYRSDCPHARTARNRLRRALELQGLDPRWNEWIAEAADTPAAYRGWPSPTVLVNGRSVTGDGPVAGTACAAAGAPSAEVILLCLRQHLAQAQSERRPDRAR